MTRTHSADQYATLSVEQALERILAGLIPVGVEQVPLSETLGRVLAEDVQADSDIPPLANSAMDGFALRAQDTIDATPGQPVSLLVIGSLAAGQVPAKPVEPYEAVRIMTGAPLPSGADAVVRFEDTTAS